MSLKWPMDIQRGDAEYCRLVSLSWSNNSNGPSPRVVVMAVLKKRRKIIISDARRNLKLVICAPIYAIEFFFFYSIVYFYSTKNSIRFLVSVAKAFSIYIVNGGCDFLNLFLSILTQKKNVNGIISPFYININL